MATNSNGGENMDYYPLRPVGSMSLEEIQAAIPAGPPGGFTAGTNLNAIDLNTVITPGLYYQSSGTNATLALNYPRNGFHGVLSYMQRSLDSGIQNYYPTHYTLHNGGSTFYSRSYQSATWGPWKAFNSTRISEAAGRASYQWDDLNNREQLIYGDTGWRDIMPTHAIAGAAGSLRIRRVGYLVELSVNIQPPDNTAANAFIVAQYPMGFSSNNMDYYGFTRPSASSAQITHRILGSGIQLSQIWTAGLGFFRLSASWTTLDAWPATLPGTAAGTIPNL